LGVKPIKGRERKEEQQGETPVWNLTHRGGGGSKNSVQGVG